MFKQRRITLEEAERGLSIFMTIPIQYVDPDFMRALKLSKQAEIYAYDAYFLDCAIRHKAPLLTLDRKLVESAQHFSIETMDVPAIKADVTTQEIVDIVREARER